jgi:heme A synthase
MYNIVLLLHSWLRWGVVIAALLATGSTFAKPATGRDDPADRWGLLFMITLDLQLLLGLVLYFGLSPNMQEILNNFSASMQRADTRFWAVEHITSMVLAVVLAHLGRILARKAPNAASKRTRLMVCFTLATILILAGMPWPGRPGGRPLFRV